MKHLHETYSGKEEELDFVGSEVLRPARYNGEYKSFAESLRSVEEHQPKGWNPEDPPIGTNNFLNDLHFLVQEGLQKRFGENRSLRLWNALGSHLDVLHGVDLIFTFHLSPQSEKSRHPFEARATLDLTRNHHKEEVGGKADIIVPLEFASQYQEMSEQSKMDFINGIVVSVVSQIEDQIDSAEAYRSRRAG